MGEAETSNCSEGLSQQEYEVVEQPLGTPRDIRIITIGAGASGLNMVRALRKHLKNFEHVVYDKKSRYRRDLV